MFIILDVVLVAIFALMVFLAVKKGFLKSLLDFVAVILAFVLAFSLSSPVAELLYDSVVEDIIISSVEAQIDEDNFDASIAAEEVKTALKELPESLVSLASAVGVDFDDIIDDVDFDKVNPSDSVNTLVRKIAEQIGNKAQSHGWDCYVGYGNFNLGSKMKAFHISSKWYKRLHAVESRLLDNHGLSSRLATKRFIKHIEKIQPDIIHIHNVHGYYINYKILFDFLKSYGKPVVWTLHDCWSFTGHCSHFVTADCDRWKTGCHDCPLRKEYPASAFLDRSRKNYEQKKEAFNGLKSLTIVPVSQWLGNFVGESFLSSNEIKVIHNGIDLNVFKPSAPKVKGTGT